ncbi:hypothetical protein N9R79_06585 [Vibrio sp.]|nr:hypothetical protein [Vibrio sp.]
MQNTTIKHSIFVSMMMAGLTACDGSSTSDGSNSSSGSSNPSASTYLDDNHSVVFFGYGDGEITNEPAVNVSLFSDQLVHFIVHYGGIQYEGFQYISDRSRIDTVVPVYSDDSVIPYELSIQIDGIDTVTDGPVTTHNIAFEIDALGISEVDVVQGGVIHNIKDNVLVSAFNTEMEHSDGNNYFSVDNGTVNMMFEGCEYTGELNAVAYSVVNEEDVFDIYSSTMGLTRSTCDNVTDIHGGIVEYTTGSVAGITWSSYSIRANTNDGQIDISYVDQPF